MIILAVDYSCMVEANVIKPVTSWCFALVPTGWRYSGLVGRAARIGSIVSVRMVSSVRLGMGSRSDIALWALCCSSVGVHAFLGLSCVVLANGLYCAARICTIVSVRVVNSVRSGRDSRSCFARWALCCGEVGVPAILGLSSVVLATGLLWAQVG